MNKKIKYLGIFAIILMIMIIPNVVKAGTTENGLTYEIKEDGVHITKGNQLLKGTIEIPNEIEGKPVVAIDKSAFLNCMYITGVNISSNIESIGFAAFYIPALVEFNVDNDNKTFSSEDGVLFNKEKSKIISFPGNKDVTSYTIPNSVSIIGRYALADARNNLINVTIPDSVKTIEVGAFAGCWKLNNIIIPNSVTSIEESVFKNCKNLVKIEIPNNVTFIGPSAFFGCESLKEIIIPNSVTTIGNESFISCSNLKKIIIPDNVKNIGERAFWNCNNLTDIVISNNVTAIKQGTFMNCKKLVKIEIPNNVTFIGPSAFLGCESLKEIIIPSSVINFHEDIFKNCSDDLVLFLEKNSAAEKYAIENELKYKYISSNNENNTDNKEQEKQDNTNTIENTNQQLQNFINSNNKLPQTGKVFEFKNVLEIIIIICAILFIGYAIYNKRKD